MFLINFFLFLFLFSPKQVIAVQDFDVSQKINYQIDNSGNATISQQIELVNNLSQIYPKEYQITLSSDQIKNVTGSDEQGNIVQNIEQKDGNTIVYLIFNQPKVGKNQITKFKLDYYLPSLAINKGNTWEIALPENQTSDSQPKIETTVTVPSTFGSISFNSVIPQNVISLNNQTEVFFRNDQKNQKILLIFGDYQLFDFSFKYFLENTTQKTSNFQITIPPETDVQKIIYRSIDPPPKNIIIDQDGNYLAEYLLQPSENIDVSINGQVKILHSNLNKDTINPKDYLKKDIYWEIDDPVLISLAKNLKTPKDIYNYVVNTLNYKTENIDNSTRQGASLAIAYPNSALCTEFTDLFVTLARINGIPAREVQGFAYSNNIKIKPINLNTDILHAWPQYYDSNKSAWVSIDPTWAKTTNGIDYFNDLDPNHFAFVFHGLNSQKPLPAGAYKNNQNIKTVSVEFARTEFASDQQPLIINQGSSKFYQSPQIEIVNPNYNSISQVNLTIDQVNFKKNIAHIPPLSSLKIDLPSIPFIQSILPQNYQIDIKLRYNSNIANFKVTNNQYWFNLVIFTAIVATLTGFGGIIIKRIRK